MPEMKLGLFIRPTGHHIASWRHPHAHADANENFDRYIHMANTAERGLCPQGDAAASGAPPRSTAKGHGQQPTPQNPARPVSKTRLRR